MACKQVSTLAIIDKSEGCSRRRQPPHRSMSLHCGGTPTRDAAPSSVSVAEAENGLAWRLRTTTARTSNCKRRVCMRTQQGRRTPSQSEDRRMKAMLTIFNTLVSLNIRTGSWQQGPAGRQRGFRAHILRQLEAALPLADKALAPAEAILVLLLRLLQSTHLQQEMLHPASVPALPEIGSMRCVTPAC